MMKSRGKANYDSCQVRQVELLTYMYDGTETVLRTDPQDVRPARNWGAILHCPKTEGDSPDVTAPRNNYESASGALNNVRRVAARMVCDTCVFSNKTPLEVSQYRSELASSETHRLKVEDEYRKTVRELGGTALPAIEP